MALIRINEIIDRLVAYHPQADTNIVQKAYVWSAKMHAGQLRKSGLPYLSHPLEVAGILTELKLHEPSIAAGLLHDVVEDTITTPEELEAEFGKEIALLVQGVTKIGKITSKTSKVEVQAENYRRMILAMAQDVRVILIKLADRLHNMRTLEYLDEGKRREIAQETLDIYAPIAGRLGIHWIKAQLEDLCLQHLHPDIFYRLTAQVAKVKEARQGYIDKARETLEQALLDAGISSTVRGRFKHLFSIYLKMERQKLSFEEVYDLLAFRILVSSVNECYDALRVIHSLWVPVPGRIKDYIALPKHNMYRSLHTTVIGPDGERVEIQIRTQEMHSIAEYGIAAHWRYKETGKSDPEKGGAEEKTLLFLSHLVEYQEDYKDPRHFLESIKSEVVPDEVVVFTPGGDLMELPKGATPLDFAFAIHSDVGLRCGGARVNGKFVDLSYELRSGDTVEIITSKTVEPTRAWLDLVKGQRARAKIKTHLATQETERVRELGRQILETELLKYGLFLGQLLEDKSMDAVAKRFTFPSPSKLFEAIGFDKFPARKVITQLVPPEQLRRDAKSPKKSAKKTKAKKAVGKKPKAAAKKAAKTKSPRKKKQAEPVSTPMIEISSLQDPAFAIAECCHPMVGEDIVALREDDSSIKIHRSQCRKVMDAHPERLITACFSDEIKEQSEVPLEIISVDLRGMLMSITSAIAESNVNILRAQAFTTKEKKAVHTFHLSVDSREQFEQMVKKLEQIEGVISVSRL